MTAPIVTVIMAARNASGTIAESVASVEAQTLTAWELIVVDDGSTDGTSLILGGLREREPRIRVLSTSGLGPSGARDAALDVARGTYVAILDADDLATQDRLAVQVAALEEDRSLSAVASSAYHFVRSGVSVGVQPATPTSKAELDRLMRVGSLIVWSNPTMCWRREALDALGGFDPEFMTGEDAELVNRALYQHGMKILGLPDKLVWYRLSRSSLSSAGLREQRMIARYLEHRNRCWIRDTEPPTLSGFLAQRRTLRVRARWARHDLAAKLYREAGFRVASGIRWGVLLRVLLSAVLHPRYVIPKLRAQRFRANWRPA